MKKHKIIAIFILLLALGVTAYAGLQLYAINDIYREGNAAYDDLSGQVRRIVAYEPDTDTPSNTALPDHAPQRTPQRTPQVEIIPMEIDFEALNTLDENIAAWLYSPNTVIDYPIMMADDYSYYLNHLPNGARNANGSLFIDFNCAPDFTDPLTVVYGHNMKSGRMFGSLSGYKAQGYFDKHPYMYLYTHQGNYRVDLLYGCVIAAGQWRERAFMYAANLNALLTYAAHNTTFTSAIQYEDGDRVIALSTCSYEFDDARYVVIGILTPEYGDP